MRGKNHRHKDEHEHKRENYFLSVSNHGFEHNYVFPVYMEIFGATVAKQGAEDVMGMLHVHDQNVLVGEDETVCRYLGNEDWMREVISYLSPPVCRYTPSDAYLNRAYGWSTDSVTVLDVAILNHYPMAVIEKMVALGCKMTKNGFLKFVTLLKKNALMYTKEEATVLMDYLKRHRDICFLKKMN